MSQPTVYTFGVAGTQGAVVQTEHHTPTPIPGIVGDVIEIATSNSDTYALTSAGTVWAWGVGSNDELGDGSTPLYVDKAVEVEFPTGTRITSLPNPMPFDGGLAIDSTGDAWGWGLNASHDLCLPGGAFVPRPTRVPLTEVTEPPAPVPTRCSCPTVWSTPVVTDPTASWATAGRRTARRLPQSPDFLRPRSRP